MEQAAQNIQRVTVDEPFLTKFNALKEGLALLWPDLLNEAPEKFGGRGLTFGQTPDFYTPVFYFFGWKEVQKKGLEGIIADVQKTGKRCISLVGNGDPLAAEKGWYEAVFEVFVEK